MGSDPRNTVSGPFPIRITGSDGTGRYTWREVVGAGEGRVVDREDAGPYAEWPAFDFNLRPDVPIGHLVEAYAFVVVRDVRFFA